MTHINPLRTGSCHPPISALTSAGTMQAEVLIAFDGALDADSAQRIKHEALLPALTRLYEKLGNSLPRPSRHLVLRCVRAFVPTVWLESHHPPASSRSSPLCTTLRSD